MSKASLCRFYAARKKFDVWIAAIGLGDRNREIGIMVRYTPRLEVSILEHTDVSKMEIGSIEWDLKDFKC